MLGFGLIGNRGLAIYLALLVFVGGAASASQFVRQAGGDLDRPIQRAILRVPVLGPALQTLALARLAWSLNLTMNAGMEVRRSFRLSLRSTRSARYSGPIELIDAGISGGKSIFETF